MTSKYNPELLGNVATMPLTEAPTCLQRREACPAEACVCPAPQHAYLLGFKAERRAGNVFWLVRPAERVDDPCEAK